MRFDNSPPDVASWNEPLRTVANRVPIPRAAQVPPFWQFKPPEGKDIQGTARGQLAAGAGATLVLTPVPAWFVIPSYEGNFQSLLMTVLAPLATLDIFFTLLNNGAAVQGWSRFSIPAVAANSFSLPAIGPLQLPENSRLTVLVTNNAASGPWDVQVDLAGWMWPRVLRQMTFGEDR